MTTYYESADNSDLSGGQANVRFNKLIEVAGQAASGTANIAGAAFNVDVHANFFTDVGVPGAIGVAGDYTVKLDIASVSIGAVILVQLKRVNSSGAVQASGAESAGQSAAIGVLTYNLSENLGTWASGDRLMVQLRVTLSSSASVTLNLGETANTSVVTPWSVGGKIKVHNGSSFVEKPVKVWNGSAWVEKPLKVHNGSTWALA